MAEPRGAVLFVEDEESIRVVGVRMLELAGYEVVCCASAAQALEHLAARDLPFDVLLSDIHLEGMKGTELAAEILRRQPAIGVVLMSGYTEADAIDSGMQPGTLFLGKPYRRDELVGAIEAARQQARA